MVVPEGADPTALGNAIWSSQIRYLGVGAMVVGGIWALDQFTVFDWVCFKKWT